MYTVCVVASVSGVSTCTLCVLWPQCLVLAGVHCVCRGLSVLCWHVYTVCVMASVSGVGTCTLCVSWPQCLVLVLVHCVCCDLSVWC